MGLILDWWEYSLWNAKRIGRLDGKGGIPAKSQTEHAHYENQLAMHTNREIRNIGTEWQEKDKVYKGNYVSALQDLLKSEKNLKKEVAESETMLSEYRCAIEDLNNSSHNPPLSPFAYWFIILLIALGEIPLTAQVFEIFGENRILTYVFALVLCVSLPATAHFAGVILREKMTRKTNLMLIANGIILLGTLGAVSWLREKFFESEVQDLLGIEMDLRMITFVFFAIQLLIFATAAMASFFAHDSHPDRKLAKRLAKTKAKDLDKESSEAKAAEQDWEANAKKLALTEALREKSFSSYCARAEEMIAHCKLLIEAYRGANVRKRGDADITSFRSYPNITLPVSLQKLDMDLGAAVPEAVPKKCGKCGFTENHFRAYACAACGNTL